MSSHGDTLKIGSKFVGRYRIKAIIGAGGMGVVYRAEEEAIARPVAIKVMKEEGARRPARLR